MPEEKQVSQDMVVGLEYTLRLDDGEVVDHSEGRGPLQFLQGHGLTHVKLMPFLSMVDRRKKLHLNMMEELPKCYPDMLRGAIPYAAEIERMGVNRAPVFAYARRSHGGRAYEALWNELMARLEGR